MRFDGIGCSKASSHAACTAMCVAAARDGCDAGGGHAPARWLSIGIRSAQLLIAFAAVKAFVDGGFATCGHGEGFGGPQAALGTGTGGGERGQSQCRHPSKHPTRRRAKRPAETATRVGRTNGMALASIQGTAGRSRCLATAGGCARTLTRVVGKRRRQPKNGDRDVRASILPHP